MKNLTQNELIEFVNALIEATKSGLKSPLSDPIAGKYLETMKADAKELEDANSFIQSNELNKKAVEADRVRDRALSVFRRTMQIYELSEDNSTEAIAYEELNELWMKKYDPLPYMSLNVETTGIDELLFDLATAKYAPHIDTLKLEEAVQNIKDTNEKFKEVYSGNAHEKELKPAYDARELRIELIETLQQYSDYINAIATLPDNKEMTTLVKILNETRTRFHEQVSARHAGTSASGDTLGE